MPKNIRDFGIEAVEQVVQEMSEYGHVPTVEFAPDAVVAEMIGTDDGAREFVETVTYNAYSGRENVPLVYKELYSTTVNSSFPQTMTAKEFGPVQVVFLKKLEGGEVKFGAMGPGTEKVVSFETWAAGLEYDEDIMEWNQTWRVTDIAVAFGEAYNKLLNHLHMSPIVTHTYTTEAGGVLAQRAKQEATTDGAAQLVAFDTDIRTTLEGAIQVLPKGSVLLHHSSDTFRIEAALASDLLSDGTRGPVANKFANVSRLVYEGDTATVGNKVYDYPGVQPGEAYLIVPKRNFREYVKHDLRIDSDDGDLSRLILTQVVGRTRRAVLAGLSGADGAIKIALQ